METKKRERSANFTNIEVQLLVNLVERHKQIIENKKTDTTTNKSKEIAWNRIARSFNSSGIDTNERSWKTLKIKYDSIKKSIRRKSIQNRMCRTGGPSNAPELTLVEKKVMSICSSIKGLDARRDSDTIPSVPIIICDIFSEEKQEVEETTPVTLSSSISYTNDTEECNGTAATCAAQAISMDTTENKRDQCHPKAPKPDLSRSSVSTRLDKLSSARLELLELQVTAAKKEQMYKEEEHEFKMEQLANDERRKEEIHALLLEKLKTADATNPDIFKNIL